MSHRSMVPQLLTRIALSRPRRSTSRRNSINTSLAPFAAQCDAVQARTCLWVQYMGSPRVVSRETEATCWQSLHGVSLDVRPSDVTTGALLDRVSFLLTTHDLRLTNQPYRY